MIAAPFLGEFGWEVALWAPWLRWMQKHHYKTEMTVVCQKGHEVLYEDFAKKVVALPQPQPQPSGIDCQNVWLHGRRIDVHDYQAMVVAALVEPGGVLRVRNVRKSGIITPLDLQTTWNHKEPPHLGKRGEFFKYGSGSGRIGMVIHARACETKQPERNWPISKWRELVEELDTPTVSVGLRSQAMHITGTEDMRGIIMAEDVDIMSAAGVVVGPSSGPLALAMLCGTPVVWWSPNKKEESRYEKYWNPFKVLTVRAAQTWDPDPLEVEVACRNFL